MTAYVNLQSWAGLTKHPVTILAETPKYYRVRWEEQAFQHGKGSVSLVPKSAIRQERKDTEAR